MTHLKSNNFSIHKHLKFCSVEEALRIDIDFDQISLDYCFKKNSGKNASFRTIEYSMKIIQGFDDDANDEEFNDVKRSAKK